MQHAACLSGQDAVEICVVIPAEKCQISRNMMR